MRRLLKNPPLVLAVKGSRGEPAEAEESPRAAGAGACWWASGRGLGPSAVHRQGPDPEPPSYQREALTLLEEDLFAHYQTTPISSDVVIEDAANKVLVFCTVSNAIDELRKASILIHLSR